MIGPGPGFDCDVAVLGAGAAGLMAAARAAECGARVVLLEKNRRAGVKILISGGTRCNITNARGLRRLDAVSGPIDPAYDAGQGRGTRSIQQAFGDHGAFLGPSLRRLDVDATVRLFEEAGVVTKIEGNGKVFPASDRAIDVLDALLRRLERSGASLRCLSPVAGIEPIRPGPRGFAGLRGPPAGFDDHRAPGDRHGRGPFLSRLRHDGRRLRDRPPAGSCDRRAPAGAGADASRGGLGRRPARASRCPTPSPRSTRRMDGSCKNGARRSSSPTSGSPVRRSWTSADRWRGPTIPSGSTLRLDLVPNLSREELDRTIQASSRQGRRPLIGLLPESIPRRLAESIVGAAGIPRDRMGPDLSRDERHRLVAACKGLTLPIRGTLGFEKAEVTSGGVSLDQVDPKTLESRVVPGLHFAGEVLDLDGLIGGYNFQAAWSTGWLAGETAARAVNESA